MSRRYQEEYDGPALRKCEVLGLHPLPFPAGETHHTEVPLTDEDRKIGDALAYFLGKLFEDDSYRYFYYEMTSVDVWTRVARALRFHGLKIADVERR